MGYENDVRHHASRAMGDLVKKETKKKVKKTSPSGLPGSEKNLAKKPKRINTPKF